MSFDAAKFSINASKRDAANEADEMDILTAREAADLLGVSGATVRNWSRAGHLNSLSLKPLRFSAGEVRSLRERINSSRFNKLRKRANKAASDRTSAPEGADSGLIEYIKDLIITASAHGINREYLLYAAAVHLLSEAGEVEIVSSDYSSPRGLIWKRPALGGVMRAWIKTISKHPNKIPKGLFLYLSSRSECEDLLGILYQGLSKEGVKSQSGAYFTPFAIIDDSLAAFSPKPESFFDPCCGTGRYLLRAADRFGIPPTRLYGFDSDPVAVTIAKINFLLRYRDMDFEPNVHCLDSLNDLANGNRDCPTNSLAGTFDAVATNPPWGGCKNREHPGSRTARIRTGESFSLFLDKSLQLLRDGGQLSFILPESFLKIKAHADIRRHILGTTSIRSVTLLGRVFSGVFTPIMRLDLVKRPPDPDGAVAVVRNTGVYYAPQRRFESNAGHSFDVAVMPGDEKLLKKIYAVDHVTLKGNADWALGIVTGDNSRYLLPEPTPGSEPILRGRDISSYAPRRAGCHICFEPEKFQQVAPESLYRTPEKLIYRFVSDRLVFAYDDKGLLTLNSANLVIPRLPGISIKAALAFLNSSIFQYIFRKRFRTRKVLRGDLETLPFPRVDSEALREIERLVEDRIAGREDREDRLDAFVFAAFGLDGEDSRVVQNGLAAEDDTVAFL